MDDLFKVALYVLAVIIYSIFKMRKKDPNKQTRPGIPQTPKQALPHTTPTRSFADAPPKKSPSPFNETIKNLEKEIKKSQEIVKPERHIKPGKIYEAKREDALERESLEREPLTYERLQGKNYENHFDKHQNYDEIQNYQPVFDQLAEIEFEYPEDEQTNGNTYADFLTDPENVKTAFVMKEVLERKYF